jgi:hypothetical protein
MSIDDLVQNIVKGGLIGNPHVEYFLKASLLVSSQRSVEYGFEWLVHTAVARYVIENASDFGVKEIGVGIKDEASGKQPDLLFVFQGVKTFLEFKTFRGNDFAYAFSDRRKLRSMTGNKFIVACGYKSREEKMPAQSAGVKTFPQIDINEGFRVIVSRIS